MLVLIQ